MLVRIKGFLISTLSVLVRECANSQEDKPPRPTVEVIHMSMLLITGDMFTTGVVIAFIRVGLRLRYSPMDSDVTKCGACTDYGQHGINDLGMNVFPYA